LARACILLVVRLAEGFALCLGVQRTHARVVFVAFLRGHQFIAVYAVARLHGHLVGIRHLGRRRGGDGEREGKRKGEQGQGVHRGLRGDSGHAGALESRAGEPSV
jgi:hypothetical protein